MNQRDTWGIIVITWRPSSSSSELLISAYFSNFNQHQNHQAGNVYLIAPLQSVFLLFWLEIHHQNKKPQFKLPTNVFSVFFFVCWAFIFKYSNFYDFFLYVPYEIIFQYINRFCMARNVFMIKVYQNRGQKPFNSCLNYFNIFVVALYVHVPKKWRAIHLIFFKFLHDFFG